MTRTGGVRRQQPRRVFRDRREAGQVLAALLDAYRGKPDVIVLGLARGGVPVAWEVARALGAPNRLMARFGALGATGAGRSHAAAAALWCAP